MVMVMVVVACVGRGPACQPSERVRRDCTGVASLTRADGSRPDMRAGQRSKEGMCFFVFARAEWHSRARLRVHGLWMLGGRGELLCARARTLQGDSFINVSACANAGMHTWMDYFARTPMCRFSFYIHRCAICCGVSALCLLPRLAHRPLRRD